MPEGDATVDVATVEEPPEPFADIARLPGLGRKSAVAAAIAGGDRRRSGSTGPGRWCSGSRSSRSRWRWPWSTGAPACCPRPCSARRTSCCSSSRWSAGRVTRDTHAAGDGRSSARSSPTCFFAIFWFIYPRGLGGGDVRLAGVLGLPLGWIGWGAAARRHLLRLPPRRDPRRAAGPAQDRGPQGSPVRAVHAAGRADRPAVGRAAVVVSRLGLGSEVVEGFRARSVRRSLRSLRRSAAGGGGSSLGMED